MATDRLSRSRSRLAVPATPAMPIGGRLLILAAVFGALGGACSGAAPGTHPSAPPTIPTGAATGSVTAAPAATPTVLRTASPAPSHLQALTATQVSIDGTTLEAGFGAVWASSSHGLLKLSPTGQSNAVVLPRQVLDVALDANAVLALVGGNQDTLVEVDPGSGKTLRQWPLAFGATSLAASADAAYVSHGTHPVTIERIDLKTGVNVSVAVSPATDGVVAGRALAVGGGMVWLASGPSIFGLDPTDLSVRVTGTATIETGDIWFGDGSLWAASWGFGGGVVRIDPTSAKVAARVAADAIQIAFSAHGVWLSANAGPTEVDPTSAVVLGTLADSDVLDHNSRGIAVLDTEVWVNYKDAGQLQRIQVP